MYDRLIKNIDNGLHTCWTFLDSTKAFDTVDHTKLRNKMYHTFGIRGIANQLLENYFLDKNNTQKYLITSRKWLK